MARLRFRILRRAVVAGLALLLGACATQLAAVQNQPPPEPLAEKLAMKKEIQAQSANALLMACLSDRAYEPFSDPVCDKLLANYIISGPQRVTYKEKLLTDPDGQYIIARSKIAPSLQIVAIKGTEGKADLLTDLNIGKNNDGLLLVPVHRGFEAYAQAVKTALEQDPSFDRTMDTVVTGHSLGGAAALLVGLYWYAETPQRRQVLAVYTFGQPRVFDNRGATSWPDFAHRVYRYENCLDFVPLIPTGDSFFDSFFVSFLGNQEASDYQHLGESILLMSSGMYWIPGSTDIDRDRLADVKAALAAAHVKKPIDHSIDDYLVRLKAVFGIGATPIAANPAGQFNQVCAPVAPGV